MGSGATGPCLPIGRRSREGRDFYRELALREGQEYKLNEVILAASRDVDRPIFYSVAVILAGYLPIYALSGPAGKLFTPWRRQCRLRWWERGYDVSRKQVWGPTKGPIQYVKSK